MTLGQRIQELRKQRDLSQEALGEKLGVSRQAVSRWEMDGAVPEVDKLIAMSRLFGVSLDLLLDVETAPRQESPAEQRGTRGARRPPLRAVCALLCAALVVSLACSLYFGYRILTILDPPQPPYYPIEAVEYAVVPDYETMTYDLALALTENGELAGYRTQVIVSTYLSEALGTQREAAEVSFRDGRAELRLEDLPFGYHRVISVSLDYAKGELQGCHYLLRLEPTGRGISWLITDCSSYGTPALSIREVPGLLAP